MSKRFMDFIRETRDEKATEKALISRAAMLVVVVVGCLAAMCLTAYAYFTCNITSDTNTLHAAKFQANVSIQLIENDQVLQTITPQKTGTWTYTASDLQVGKSYTVTVSPAQNNTASTGYVAITANGCSNAFYHTQQLNTVATAAGESNGVTFKLMVTDTTTVTFETRWGTSAFYPEYKENGTNPEQYILSGEEIMMVINGITQAQTEPPVSEPSASEPSASEPSASEPSASEPSASEPPASEPSASEPSASEPPASEPPASEPSASEPSASEPSASEPSASEPPASEPSASEPPAGEPSATDPAETQPPETEDEVAESAGEETQQ